MEPLIKTNPYLRDPALRRLMIERSVRESSVFEGARGLPKMKARQKAELNRRLKAVSEKTNQASTKSRTKPTSKKRSKCK